MEKNQYGNFAVVSFFQIKTSSFISMILFFFVMYNITMILYCYLRQNYLVLLINLIQYYSCTPNRTTPNRFFHV